MKIEINQTSPTTWGKLGIAEARIAAERLSGNGFKTWVLLALNQDGYTWNGDLEPRTFQELADYSYLIPLQDGNFLFRPDGEPGDFDAPAEWEKVAGLYGSSGQQDLLYVRNKLQSVYLDGRLEDILSYWAEKYHSLQELDHSKTINSLKYDFSVLLVWWLWDNFRFEPGDDLEVGQDAKLLRFHDSAFKEKTQRESRNRKMTVAHIQDGNCSYWNAPFFARKFEIPLKSVAKILKRRNQVSDSAGY